MHPILHYGSKYLLRRYFYPPNCTLSAFLAATWIHRVDLYCLCLKAGFDHHLVKCLAGRVGHIHQNSWVVLCQFFGGISQILRHMETGFLRFFPEAIVWAAQGLVRPLETDSETRRSTQLFWVVFCVLFFGVENPANFRFQYETSQFLSWNSLSFIWASTLQNKALFQ